MLIARLVAASIAVTSLACSASAIPGPPAGLTHAAIRPSCGPADGPAVQILLASAPVGTGETSTPYVAIYIWRSVDELREAVLVIGGDQPTAGAWYYASPGQPVVAKGGIVRVASVSADKTVEGSVDLTFEDGRRVRGGFRAGWIPALVLCG
jgi:hypothetical protein